MGTQGKVGIADTIWVYERRDDEQDGKLHIRGRDVEEQTIVITMVEGHIEYVGEGQNYTEDTQRRQVIDAIDQIQEAEGRAAKTKEILQALELTGDHYHRIRQLLYRMYNAELIGKTSKGDWTRGSSDDGEPF
jgi:hypothetical protein